MAGSSPPPSDPTPAAAPLFAIGDVHGDLDALLRILLGLGLIEDREGAWSGGGARLVTTGDLVDRGPAGMDVVAFMQRLQAQAAEAGGRVESLLGNHEVMLASGEHRLVSAEERAALARFRCAGRRGLDAFYRGDGPWATWLRERPVALVLDRHLLVHAGLDEPSFGVPLSWMNEQAAAWMARLQTTAGTDRMRRPEGDGSHWIVDPTADGPLWTDRYRIGEGSPLPPLEFRQTLETALDDLGVDCMVVGHRPTWSIDFAVASPHPRFGDRVALIDTGICRAYGGRLSAVELAAGARPTVHEVRRGGLELPVTERVRDWAAAERAACTAAQATAEAEADA